MIGPWTRLIVHACLIPVVVSLTTSEGHCGPIGVAPQSQTREPDVGFAPSTHAAADAMLRLARVAGDDVVYDLGSGDGRIVNLAAKYGARAVGIELDSRLAQKARLSAVEAKVADRVTIIEADLFTADISEATVVTLYLWPSVNKQLEWKLRRELRPGTRVVSNSFGIGNWTPDDITRAEDGTLLFLWTVPRPPARVPDVDFIPTDEPMVDEMLRLAGVGASDVVYDLGSGDGRIPMLAATKYGARAMGIELDPRLVDISRQVARESGLSDRVSFVEGDLFAADLSDATVVVLSLSPGVNAKLEPKLRALRPGTRIVSRQFPIGTWTPDRDVRARDGTTLYLWIVPAPQSRPGLVWTIFLKLSYLMRFSL